MKKKYLHSCHILQINCFQKDTGGGWGWGGGTARGQCEDRKYHWRGTEVCGLNSGCQVLYRLPQTQVTRQCCRWRNSKVSRCLWNDIVCVKTFTALCERPKSCHITLPGCGEAAGNVCWKDETCSNHELLQPNSHPHSTTEPSLLYHCAIPVLPLSHHWAIPALPLSHHWAIPALPLSHHWAIPALPLSHHWAIPALPLSHQWAIPALPLSHHWAIPALPLSHPRSQELHIISCFQDFVQSIYRLYFTLLPLL